MSHYLKVYLAGPDVFLPDAAAMGRKKKDLCHRFGFEGLFPLDGEVDPTLPPEKIAAEIYRANMKLIRQADFGIFNLTPFRGVSADVGTVFELGAFVGAGKPVFGYSNSVDDLLARAERAGLVHGRAPGRGPVDADGLTIEDFQNADNLMIDRSLAESGTCLHRIACDDPARDVQGFVACLEEARSRLGSPAIKISA